MPRPLCGHGLTLLGPDQGEFARIKPVAAAVRALIHFHSTFGAKEMSVQLHTLAPGTPALAGRVHDYAFVTLEVEQGFPRSLTLFIDLLQFEAIKPNPAATALTGIENEIADLQFR
jgi:hypothetical protein